MNNLSFHIRQFTANEVAAYRAIRLEALESDPEVFGNNLATESAMPESEWVDRVVNQRFARFGLYDGAQLIGLTAVVVDKDNAEEGYMTQSYIRKAYRGQKLSRLLYEARLSWAREHNIKRLTIMHRASNLASKYANQHFGFKFTHAEPKEWVNGETEDMVCYELLL